VEVRGVFSAPLVASCSARSAGVVILVITYFSLVIGELAPKALALRNPERLACAMAPLVTSLTKAFAGVVCLLIISANLVLRLLWQEKAQRSPFISEEEVKYLVREGAAKGSVREGRGRARPQRL
jgi:putative hemolysin